MTSWHSCPYLNLVHQNIFWCDIAPAYKDSQVKLAIRGRGRNIKRDRRADGSPCCDKF